MEDSGRNDAEKKNRFAMTDDNSIPRAEHHAATDDPPQYCRTPIGFVDLLRIIKVLGGPVSPKDPLSRVLTDQGLVCKPTEKEQQQGENQSPAPSPNKCTGPQQPPTEPPQTRESPTNEIEKTMDEESYSHELLQPIAYSNAIAASVELAQTPGLDAYSVTDHNKALPYRQPLFPPKSQRSILSMLASTWRPGRNLDVRGVVEVLARGRHVSVLPRKVVRGLSRQVQVLLDVSQGMLPFRRDQVELVNVLETVLGNDAIDVLRTNGSPMDRKVASRNRGKLQYEVPISETPIVVLSDLGSAPGGGLMQVDDEARWIQFAVACRQRGCSVAVLSPYAQRRYSPALKKQLAIITWDRCASVREAARPLTAQPQGHRHYA
nr:hypothetical protein [uncultured Desulfobacter sp.]